MTTFIGGRLIKAVLIIAAIAVLNFVIVRLAPGDPASVIAGQSGVADQVFMDQLRKQFGLDRPVHEQLAIYLKGIAQLDLGISHPQQKAVTTLIVERLPATLLLTCTAFVVAVGLGTALGLVAAQRAGTGVDALLGVFSLVFFATPIFWVGIILTLVFSVWLDWLPALGAETVGANLDGVAKILDLAKHLVLPALTLGLFYMAVYARLARSTTLEVLSQDFVRTARAKGASETRVILCHVLRNMLIPVITFAGIQAGQLIGGTILVETVFSWPGIGRLAYEALLARDYNVLLGVFFFTSLMVVVFNLVTDVVCALIDPRIQVNG